jgi:hypothetical protein
MLLDGRRCNKDITWFSPDSLHGHHACVPLCPFLFTWFSARTSRVCPTMPNSFHLILCTDIMRVSHYAQFFYCPSLSVNTGQARVLFFKQALYKVVQIWAGLIVCKQVTVFPGLIWITLYQRLQFVHLRGILKSHVPLLKTQYSANLTVGYIILFTTIFLYNLTHGFFTWSEVVFYVSCVVCSMLFYSSVSLIW